MTQKAWTEKKFKKIICVLYWTFAVRSWNIRTDSVSNVAWGLFYNNKKKEYRMKSAKKTNIYMQILENNSSKLFMVIIRMLL